MTEQLHRRSPHAARTVAYEPSGSKVTDGTSAPVVRARPRLASRPATASGLSHGRLLGVPTGSFAATGRVIHVISPPKSGRAER